MLTDLSFLSTGKPWPPKEEADRIATYQENMLLRKSDFSGLTNSFPLWQDLNRLLREDAKKDLSLYFGYFGFITRKTNDLLWGTPPEITATSEGDTSALHALLADTSFKRIRKEVGWDVSSLGTGLFKVFQDAEGSVKIQSNTPDCWHPIVQSGSIRDVQYHVLANEFSTGENENHLKIEIHSPDAILHQVWRLAKNTVTGLPNQIAEREELTEYFPGLKDEEPNPVGEFLVIPVHNLRLSDNLYGMSDYSPDLKSILRALILRYSQRQRILDKHADPSIIAPKGMFRTWDPVTQKQIARSGGRLLEYDHDPGTSSPDVRYLTWEANLAAVEQEIKDLKQEFCTLSGMPPQFFSMELAGTAESGTALFFKMQNLLSKVSDLKEEFDESLQAVIRIATKLTGKEIQPSIKWNDGLKIPFAETAQAVSLLVTSGILAGESGILQALLKLGYDQATAEQIAADSTRAQGGMM